MFNSDMYKKCQIVRRTLISLLNCTLHAQDKQMFMHTLHAQDKQIFMHTLHAQNEHMIM